MSETAVSNRSIEEAWHNDPRVRDLVAHLRYLAANTDKISECRAALAELRQGVQNPIRAARHVAPYLGERDQPDEEWFYQVASLFALHRVHAERVTLGDAFRRMNDDSGSVEKRFLSLLSARKEQLPDHLRHAVSLLKAREIPLDWERLLYDVKGWDREGKPVQRYLARRFYRKSNDTTDPTEGGTDPISPDETGEGE